MRDIEILREREEGTRRTKTRREEPGISKNKMITERTEIRSQSLKTRKLLNKGEKRSIMGIKIKSKLDNENEARGEIKWRK